MHRPLDVRNGRNVAILGVQIPLVTSDNPVSEEKSPNQFCSSRAQEASSEFVVYSPFRVTGKKESFLRSNLSD